MSETPPPIGTREALAIIAGALEIAGRGCYRLGCWVYDQADRLARWDRGRRAG